MFDFEKHIYPFKWQKQNNQYCVILDELCSYKQSIFNSRVNTHTQQLHQGDAYDWQALVIEFLPECPHLEDAIGTYASTDKFYIYSDDAHALRAFIFKFKFALDDDKAMSELFSRADLGKI